MTEYNGKNLEEMSFEECLSALQELVSQLESGNLDLDKSLEVYERAMEIRNKCKNILEETERKVEKLVETADGLKKEEFKIQ